MFTMIAKGLAIILMFVLAAWLLVGNFSDYLVGNRKIYSEPLACDDAGWCAAIRDLFIVDVHSDTLLHRNPKRATDAGHADLNRMITGGVDLQIFAIASVAPTIETQDGAPCGNFAAGDRLDTYFFLKEPLRPATWAAPMARVDTMLQRFEAALADPSEERSGYLTVRSSADLDSLEAAESPVLGALLAIEGAYWASPDEAELRHQLDALHEAGIRMIGLTHRASNHLAGSNEDCGNRLAGLSPLGKFMVEQIWTRNMVLDLAHASSQTIADVADLAASGAGGGVVVSHTGVQAACVHNRNLTDEDVRNIARMNGVIGLGFWTTVNCMSESVSAQEAKAAIARSFGAALAVLSASEFVRAMGPGYDPVHHIGLGSDFDGATLVPSGSEAIPWYLEGIAGFETGGRKPFDDQAIARIAGLNIRELLVQSLTP